MGGTIGPGLPRVQVGLCIGQQDADLGLTIKSRIGQKRAVGGVGLRMMSIGPTGEVFTKGNCSLVAPVNPLVMKLLNPAGVPVGASVETPLQLLTAAPVGGKPPVQLPEVELRAIRGWAGQWGSGTAASSIGHVDAACVIAGGR